MMMSILKVLFATAGLVFFSATVFALDMHAGVTAHFIGGRTDPALFRGMAMQGGMDTVRIEAPWSGIETVKDQLGFPPEYGAMQQAVDNAATDGMHALLVLDYGNRFYDNGAYPISDDAQAGFVRYAKYVVNHFKGKVRYYEIWNEWNGATGLVGVTPYETVQSARDYARLVRKVYLAIKEIDPDAKVIAGAAINRDAAWLTEVVVSADGHYDGISVHPYNFLLPQNRAGDARTPEEMVSWLDGLYGRLRQAAGGQPIDLYVTETGWTNATGKYGTSEEMTAAYMARLLLLAARRPFLKGIWWYDFIDDGNDPRNGEQNFGLLRWDTTPKPALRAMHGAMSLLRATRSTRACSTRYPLGCQVFVASDGSQSYALWTVNGRTLRVTVRGNKDVPGRLVAQDITPAEMAASVNEDPVGPASVVVGAMPVLIRGGEGDLTFSFAENGHNPARRTVSELRKQ